MNYTVLPGDNRISLPLCVEDNSIDAVVTDPPYGLSKEPNAAEVLRHWLAGDDYKATGGGFMGKSWDSFVPGPATWREVFRCLKPGGHALVFAGSRTQDLMSMSLRLAGFEIRDCARYWYDGAEPETPEEAKAAAQTGGGLAWVYGVGFPKSLDISKAVEKAHGIGASRQRALQFTAWMRSSGITARQINDATNSNMGSHYLTDKEQPAVATLEMYAAMAHLLPPPPPEIWQLMEWRTVESENMKRREVVGSDTKARSSAGNSALPTMGADTIYRSWDITAAHTEAAKQWEGWGTALKPAYEPIIIARKPLDGTVADNVLTHGVGGLNIDGCRVNPGEKVSGGGANFNAWRDGEGREDRPQQHGHPQEGHDKGRWPANVMHDGSDEVLAGFPQSGGQRGAVSGNEPSSKTVNTFGEDGTREAYSPRGDSGSAARFFYCPKASKADRNEGLDHLPEWSAGEVTGGRVEGSDGLNSPRAGAGRTSGAHNHHPTVKPTELMRYLCRLVTPPGGLILDPFAGSGSTGKAAILEGFRVLLCEQDETYLPIIDARCKWAVSQNTPDTSR